VLAWPCPLRAWKPSPHGRNFSFDVAADDLRNAHEEASARHDGLPSYDAPIARVGSWLRAVRTARRMQARTLGKDGAGGAATTDHLPAVPPEGLMPAMSRHVRPACFR